MTIEAVLLRIKIDFETVIRTASFNGKMYLNWQKSKEALIRSQRIINYLHEYVKYELVQHAINPDSIYPPVWLSKPEIKLTWFLKDKDQDITVVPKKVDFRKGVALDQCLSINIRSQLSSMQKNIDTLYERTFAEALNLHLLHPKICLGEVYLIPTHEYDDREMLSNNISFKKVSKLEKYLRMFLAISNRRDSTVDPYKYERVVLLIVDFRQDAPKLYHTIADLVHDGLLPVDIGFSQADMDKISITWFFSDLLGVYGERFNLNDLI